MLRIPGSGALDCDGVTRAALSRRASSGLAVSAGPTCCECARGPRLCPPLAWFANAPAGASSSSGSAAGRATWRRGTPSPTPSPSSAARSAPSAPAVPGVQFGELLPEQARLMDRLAVLRTVNHGTGDHTKANHWMLTGFEGPAFNAPDFQVQRRPSMGSAVAQLRGANRPGLPPYVAVPHLRGGTDNFFHYAAYLGGAANPFIVESDPNTPEFRVKNLALPDGPAARPPRRPPPRPRRAIDRAAPRGRPRRRRPRRSTTSGPSSLLTGREVGAAPSTSPPSPPKLRDRYGRHTFGQSALLARRLVEAGVTFVTVNCVPWDHHGTPPQLTDRGWAASC